jgi:hypothetical protein
MRFVALGTVLALTACDSGGTTSELTGASEPIMACAERGMTYFKMIRSYPTLHSTPNIGRSATEVALERCKLDSSAF